MEYVLGLDVGTTSVKAVLLNAVSGAIASKQAKDTQAAVQSRLEAGHEQDPVKILSTVHICVSRLPRDALKRVTKIGISGQMHGVVLWKGPSSWEYSPRQERYDLSRDKTSHLYTWQDGRCNSDFFAALPKPRSHLRVGTGYGCATLFWLHQQDPLFLEQFTCAGTIQDLVVAMLCGREAPMMSIQIAASWGFFNTTDCSWNEDILSRANFPVRLLPEILSPDSGVAGTLLHPWCGIPAGTPVSAAFGDMQCSVFSTLDSTRDAVLNISTSAQLSYIMPEGFSPPEETEHSRVEYFPFFSGRYLAVAASLNGGNVLAHFVGMIQQWVHTLGFSIPQESVWKVILSQAKSSSSASDLEVVPLLLRERHCPDSTASVSNITLSSMNLGKVTRAVCRGIVANLHSMLSREELVRAGIERIQGTGSALARNPVLQLEVESQYQLPVTVGQGGDSALGAARAMLHVSDPRR